MYKMICTLEELPKLHEEIDKDEELKKLTLDINIVKEFNKNRKYIDEDDYDDSDTENRNQNNSAIICKIIVAPSKCIFKT